MYTFPVLVPEACDAMVAEGHHALETGAAGVLAASAAFNRAHVVLDALGGAFPALQDWLLLHLLQPAAALAWPALRGPLDYRYGYIVGYAPAAAIPVVAEAPGLLTRAALRKHTDDSEVTLNVQLSDPSTYDGGELLLGAVRGREREVEASESCRLKVPRGTGILHLGQHLHEVTGVTAGRRYAWITWARSHALRASTCPCCLTLRPGGAPSSGPTSASLSSRSAAGGGAGSGCICDGSIP